MKKLSILAFALVAIAANAFAFECSGAFYPKSAQHKTESRASEGYDLRFCGDLYTWYRTVNGSNYTYRVYLAITADMATQLAGNQITDITFSPYLQSGRKTATVFVSEDLDQDPVATADKTVTMGTIETVSFADPYVIKEGQAFYFGYTISECGNKDYPVGIDSNAPNEFCGYIETIKNGESQTVSAAELDANVFLYAHTAGEKDGLIDVFGIGAVTAGEVSHPVVTNCGNASLMLPVFNFGSNAITSLAYSVDGEKYAIDIDVPGCTNAIVEIPVGAVAPGQAEVSVTVESVNGIAADYGTSTASFMAISGNGYPRRLVVEELTGAWCGYCPMGIVGFEYMSETYPEEFIGIAVHSGDTMAVTSYATLDNTMGQEMGYPSCWPNRDPMFYCQPDPETLQILYDIWSTQRAIAKIDLNVYYYDGVLTADAKTTFDTKLDDVDYALAFVILEDGYIDQQANYFAGGSYGEMGGWENKKSKVEWTYEHVARDIFNYKGLSESAMTSVQAGVANTFTYDLNLRNVQDVAKTSVVALLLNTATGEIANATKVDAADYLTTGIESAIGDSYTVRGGDGTIAIDSANATATVYNIAGQHVATVMGQQTLRLNAGVYIVRIGDKSYKTIVK